MNDDLQQQLRNLADEASPRPGSEDVVVKRAKTKRRLIGGFAAFVLVATIGGLAGATTLLRERDAIKPAPGPEETAGCVSAGYDLAVFVPEEDFHDKMVELNDRLERHGEIANFQFVSAADARQEYLRENPNARRRLPTFATRSQYRVTVDAGVDPNRLARRLADIGDGAYVPALDCPPVEPQEKFARYFFEVAEGRSSARGTLAVSWEARTICLDVDVSEDLVASHLIDQHPELPDGVRERDPAPVVMATFFELGDRFGSVPTEPICLRDQEHEILRQVIEDHQRFAVDFHRGPDDEPGLVAELTSVPRRVGGPLNSLDDAMTYLSDRLDILVALPEQLPEDIRLAPRQPVTITAEDGTRSGRLELRFGKNGILLLDFGRASFDGCGGDDAVVVGVNGETGLMLAKDEYPWTQIIWPAQRGEREATYGIYGSLPGAEMLELARSMPPLEDGSTKQSGACS